MVYEESKDKAQIGDFTPFENGHTVVGEWRK